ncbi:MAG: 30S ribosomal protein S7 [Myxococcota bacterium]
MPRKGQAPKRKINLDPVYRDIVVAKFINSVMKSGKKSAAEKITYGAFEIIKEKTKKDPLEVFRKALDNVKPSLEVKSRRIGGANYQVPVEVRSDRRQALAIRWIIEYARSRSERTMKVKLANEIIDASENRGGAVKKREDVHKMAEANKAFSHFRW